VQRVSQKLGFSTDVDDDDEDVTADLKFADVLLVYDICRFEKVADVWALRYNAEVGNVERQNVEIQIVVFNIYVGITYVPTTVVR
jgi:hypothetical protein